MSDRNPVFQQGPRSQGLRHFCVSTHYRVDQPTLRWQVLAPENFSVANSFAVVSSRISRKDFFRWSTWLQQIGVAVAKAKPFQGQLITASKVSTDRFARFAAQKNGLTCFQIELRSQRDLAERPGEIERIATNPNRIIVFPADSSHENDTHVQLQSARDDLIAAVSETIYLTGLNPKSKSEQRIFDRLAQSKTRAVHFTDEHCLIQSSLQKSLANSGATPWDSSFEHCISFSDAPLTSATPSPVNPSPVTPSSVRQARPGSMRAKHAVAIMGLQSFLESDANSFLFHCTRSNNGRWPNQTEAEAINEVMYSPPARRTPLHVLTRIANQSRILATDKLNRAGQPVVSFTENPLQKIIRLRRFQSHLSRWDFEPYGVGIHRNTIRRLGGRPVIYGPSEHYTNLPDGQKHLFQLDRSTTKSGNRIDWRLEKEWRISCEIDLCNIPFTEKVLFVKRHEDANQLADNLIHPWKIVVLESAG